VILVFGEERLPYFIDFPQGGFLIPTDLLLELEDVEFVELLFGLVLLLLLIDLLLDLLYPPHLRLDRFRNQLVFVLYLFYLLGVRVVCALLRIA